MTKNFDDSFDDEILHQKILCFVCKIEIIEYYEEKYKGNRGRCPTCKIDFPLE